MELLFIPPLAFGIYLALVGLLDGIGKIMAARTQPSPLKTGAYASGEQGPMRMALPGYRHFFAIALFFAILHLGALVLGSGEWTWLAGAYVVGMVVVLTALVLK